MPAPGYLSKTWTGSSEIDPVPVGLAEPPGAAAGSSCLSSSGYCSTSRPAIECLVNHPSESTFIVQLRVCRWLLSGVDAI